MQIAFIGIENKFNFPILNINFGGSRLRSGKLFTLTKNLKSNIPNVVGLHFNIIMISEAANTPVLYLLFSEIFQAFTALPYLLIYN